jgi:hypothetical protein
VPGMWSNWRTAPTKWDALQPPPRRISAEEVKAIELLEVLFAGENGYDIARILKPRMTSQPLQMITEPGDYKVIPLLLFSAWRHQQHIFVGVFSSPFFAF